MYIFDNKTKYSQLTELYLDRLFRGISKNYDLYYDIYYRWCDNQDYELMKKLTELYGIKPKDKYIVMEIMK